MPECRIVGTSLEDFDDDEFRSFARMACHEFANHPVDEEQWVGFARTLTYVSQAKGPDALASAVEYGEKELGGEPPGCTT